MSVDRLSARDSVSAGGEPTADPANEPVKRYTQWRAVAADESETPDGSPSWERGMATNTRAMAERDLAEILDAEPPYDSGWIERRTVTAWERVDAGSMDHLAKLHKLEDGSPTPTGRTSLPPIATCSYCGGTLWVCRGVHTIA